MITDKKTRTIETSGVLDQAAYHIDESAMGHITSILSNMYSDPPLAVVREYFSNATDAHTAAGVKDKPVEIKIPTKLDPTFVVRDFGKGLSVPETKRLLGGYGASGDDKRTSNDMIGGFGIGAKVGFAVSSAFNYTIYHDGRKRIWSCYLDEHDRGRMSMLGDDPTTEPSGIEITIPVAESWVDGFQAATDKAFLFAQIKPKLTGIPKNRESSIQITEAVGGYALKLNIDGQDATVKVSILSDAFTKDDDSNYRGSHDSHYRIVIGNAGYSVDITKLGMSEKQQKDAEQLLENIRIEAPIGFLQVAPSREALQYSQRTIKVLRGMLEALLTPRIGLHIAESVAGMTAAQADLPGLAILSLGLDRLYGAGQSKTVIDSASAAYKGWIDDSSKFGIGVGIPADKVKSFASTAPDVKQKCAAYAFRLSLDTNRYGNKDQWSIKRVHTSTALAAVHGTSSGDNTLLACTLDATSSEYTFYKTAASVLASRHDRMIKSGKSKNRVVYLIAWAITPGILSEAVCDAVMFDSPFIKENVVQYINHPDAVMAVTEGSALIGQGYYGAYQLHSDMNEPYRRSSRVRTSWNAGQGAGATKVAAHSRKFVVPAAAPNPNSDKASDLWEAALASDVKNNGLVYIPLDEFRVVSPGATSMIDRTISRNASFLAHLKHPDIVALFDGMVENVQLVGVRVSEVESLKANPNYVDFWTACRNVLGEAIKEQAFADALLVRLALDSDTGPTRRFLGLTDFVVSRGIRVSWYTEALRWAKAFKRAEAYGQADSGLFRLASACYGLVRHSVMWDKAGSTNKILGDVTGTALATVSVSFECSAEYNSATNSKHILLALWKKAIEEYPMIPYIIPDMVDECGHSSPFGQYSRHTVKNAASHPRQCHVTLDDNSIGDEYLETYLRVVPALTDDFVIKSAKKRKQ